jgi:hypothetical protein
MTLFKQHIDQMHLGAQLKLVQSAIDLFARNSLASEAKTLTTNAVTLTAGKFAAVITTESLTTAHTAAATLVITVAGAVAGDLVMISPVGGTNTGGVPVFNAVVTTDTVTITLRNNAIATNAFNGTFIFNMIVFKK